MFSQLVDEAMALPMHSRAAWLARLPSDSHDLRTPLQHVLDGLTDALATSFMLEPPRNACARDQDPAIQAGQRIGPYELLRELGRGGMGVVWLARRMDGAYQLDVALKLPHAHLLTGAVRERFIRERDILASLSHPNIARFYDAGLSAQGQPYLALEAVEGVALTHWAREQGLGLKQRLALFRQVADAVEYAHSRLVAHRDLKPANVLVTAQGQVRLLDFGIAKLLNEADDPEAPLTRAGGRLATPEYAAPEQLQGGAVTVATDVYALAAVLFELLTGTSPFSTEGHGGLLDIGVWTPQREDPPLASARVIASHAEGLGYAAAKWRQLLIGDLDAILYKALQVLPEHRYSSVAAFAADLDRYLSSQPINARRITFAIRATKFLRRHRMRVAFSGLLGVSIIVGVAGMAWQAQVARAQTRRAEAVKEFLLDVFKASDPRQASETPRGQITAKALLDLSAPKIERSFKADPAIQIELLRAVADIYRELGESEAYEKFQARQLELSVQHYGALHDNVIDGAIEAANRASARADYSTCRDFLSKADQTIRLAGRDESALRGHWWLSRSVCLRDMSSAALEREAALQTALRTFERFAPNDPGHVTTLAEIATEASHQNRYEDSISLNRRAITLAAGLPQRNDAELQTLYGNLALGLQQLGDLVAAEAAYAQAAELARRTSGEDARTAWVPAAKRARTAHLAGDRVRAGRLFEEVIQVLPVLGAHDPDAQSVWEDFGNRLAAQGSSELAVPMLEGVERSYAQRPPQDFALRRIRWSLGDAYDRAGRAAEARRTLALALVDYEAKGAPDSQPVAGIHERWGRFLLDHGDVAAAKTQFERVLADAKTKTWTHVALAHAGLARVALAQADPVEAARLSAVALATWSRRTGFFDVRMEPYLWRVRASALAASGDSLGAQSLRVKALTASQTYDAPESPSTQSLLFVGM